MNKFYYLFKCLIHFTFKVMIVNFILLIYFSAKRKNLLFKIIKLNYFLIMKTLMLKTNKKENKFFNNRLFYFNKFFLNKI